MAGLGAQRSLWLEEALAADGGSDAPPLEGEAKADVCIVGGGFTGLWTALAIKEAAPSCSVAVVEKDVCGGGASGRNGGFLLTWAAKFGTLEKMFGTQKALDVVRLAERAVDEIGRFCTAHDIDAHFRREGWLWTASNASQVGSWRSTTGILVRNGLDLFRDVDKAECRSLSGSARHLAGVLAPNAATVHPARLVRGLRRVAQAKGVRIHERSRMVRLHRDPRPAVETVSGKITAERVVLAMNAWSGEIPDLAHLMVVVGSDIVATEPCPELLQKLGFTGGLAISDSRLFTHYYRLSRDGRMVFGKGGGDFVFGTRVDGLFDGESRYRPVLERTLEWFYPEFEKIGKPRTWSGPIDRTMTGLPVFGRLADCPDVLYGFGYSGNGVGPAYVGGRVLASLCLDRDDEWSRMPLVGAQSERFPPEPFRYVGARVIQSALRRKERAEDAGRAPARIDVALSALMPGGMVPVEKKNEG